MTVNRVVKFGVEFDSSSLQRGVDAANRKLDALQAKGTAGDKAISLLQNKFVLAGAAAIGFAASAAKAIRELSELAQHGMRVHGVAVAFGRATIDQTEALEGLREVTKGLITDYDLMLAYNRAVTLGAATNAEEFGNLARTAIDLGRALGRDAGAALEDLSIGIGRQSRLILDNLGIIVSVREANEHYAAALGKTVAQLTAAEKREAFRLEALGKAREAADRLGQAEGGAGEATVRLDTAIDNLKDAFAELIDQEVAIQNFFNNLATAIDKVADALPALWAGVKLGVTAATGITFPGPRPGEGVVELGEPRPYYPRRPAPPIEPTVSTWGVDIRAQREIEARWRGAEARRRAAEREEELAWEQHEAQLERIMELSAATNAKFDAEKAAVKSTADLATEAWEGAARRIGDAVIDAAMQGELSWRRLADIIATTLAARGAESLIDIGVAALGGLGGGGKDVAKTMAVKGFQAGGIVPGPRGKPQLAVVHGGEEIVPASGTAMGQRGLTVRQNIYFNVAAMDAPSVAAFLQANKGAIAKVVADAVDQSGAFRRRLTGYG